MWCRLTACKVDGWVVCYVYSPVIISMNSVNRSGEKKITEKTFSFIIIGIKSYKYYFNETFIVAGP